MTGMFDQLGKHSGGLSNGRVQAEKKFPFSYDSECSMASPTMYFPFDRNSWAELISQFSAISGFVWQ